MEPEYLFGQWAVGDDENGESVFIPAEYADDVEWDENGHEIVEGWGYRLQMPGYLDSTEWGGPCETEEEAREELSEVFDVNPFDGSPLDQVSISIDNLDRTDGLVFVTLGSDAAAEWQAAQDPSIRGSNWENGDGLWYALIPDEPDLVETLEGEGYNVEDSEYSYSDAFATIQDLAEKNDFKVTDVASAAVALDWLIDNGLLDEEDPVVVEFHNRFLGGW